jgi:HSP20 family protein
LRCTWICPVWIRKRWKSPPIRARRESREGYRRVERITGEFQRRFSLPDSADAQNIKAKFVNGVLEVAIPKLAQVQPHRITVEAA